MAYHFRVLIINADVPTGPGSPGFLGDWFWGRLSARARWEFVLLMYLVPTVIYGALMFGPSFPEPQGKSHRIKLASMTKEFFSPLLLSLLALMAMIGFVELGADSWIANITGNLPADPTKGLYLFIWTSSLMFALRFFAGPIVHRISPHAAMVPALMAVGFLLLIAYFHSIGGYRPIHLKTEDAQRLVYSAGIGDA
jgi:hypothetical protein